MGDRRLADEYSVTGFSEVGGDGFDHAAGVVKSGPGEVGPGGGAGWVGDAEGAAKEIVLGLADDFVKAGQLSSREIDLSLCDSE